MANSPLKERIVRYLEDEQLLGYNELRCDTQYSSLFAEEPQWLRTVQLFCFGTYTHYLAQQTEGEFIELSDLAVHKLRMLTLASECLKSNTITYRRLQEALDIEGVTTLEVFLAESVFTGVVDAVVFGSEQLVKVKSSVGRDVLLPGEVLDPRYDGVMTVDGLLQGLCKFEDRIGQSLEYVEQISQDLEESAEHTGATTGQGSSVDLPSASSKRKRKIETPK